MKLLLFLTLMLCPLLTFSEVRAETAKAILNGTTPQVPVEGEAIFEETQEGLKVSIEFKKAPAGLHGIHIHENGSCEDGGKAAGDHFNPEGAPHGFLLEGGLTRAHAGDFGNIEIREDGTGTLKLTFKEISLNGRYGVVGRSVILHEKADEFIQPLGNAGSRIGCGSIEMIENA
ncbi:MAG: superoxide dismutase family protein [Candidatus Omnitrophica bacterium]|nr:superoxide dismutase family protein [Candidatus Omnitrophota bacterium]